jgi:hypothetical protein
MQRRKFLAAIGSVAAGGAAAMGTGAFDVTGTRQQRGLTAQVEGGASANLGITPNTDNDFVNDGGSGDALDIDFTADNGGAGLNINGVTEVRPAFTLTNNFDQPFYVEVYNPLRNNDIADSQTNDATESQGSGSGSGGSYNRVEVPPGLDVQFVAASDGVFSSGSGGSKNEGDVALVDRAAAPAAYDFQDPEDPSTMQVDLSSSTPEGGKVDYIGFDADDDAGYLRLGSGASVDVVVRAIVNERFFPSTKAPDTLDNKLTSEFTIRAYNDADAMIATDDAVLGTDVPDN